MQSKGHSPREGDIFEFNLSLITVDHVSSKAIRATYWSDFGGKELCIDPDDWPGHVDAWLAQGASFSPASKR